jgi:hypothetical protein
MFIIRERLYAHPVYHFTGSKQLFLLFFSHSSQALHSVAKFVFQCSFSSFLSVYGSRMPISCSHYFQILFSHISLTCLWFSSCLSILASNICFGILSLFRRSLRPYHLNLTDYVFNNVRRF